MSSAPLPLPQLRGAGETSRTDAWWMQPLVVFLGLMAFLIYVNWAAFQGKEYFFAGGGAHYLSPFYSPLLVGQPGEPRLFATDSVPFWPSWLPFSPAFLILAVPAGFRFTCYYYRGAYYKAFWGDPLNCAVGEPGFRGTNYRGEEKFPLILQNIHRFMFYLAAAFILILLYDAVRAFIFETPGGGHTFGVAVGSLVLLLNVILLGGYTFGCHCARHLSGGRHDRISEKPVSAACYTCVSWLNRKHMLWAWMSLIWVGLSDVYVRMLCKGIITDFRIF